VIFVYFLVQLSGFQEQLKIFALGANAFATSIGIFILWASELPLGWKAFVSAPYLPLIWLLQRHIHDDMSKFSHLWILYIVGCIAYASLTVACIYGFKFFNGWGFHRSLIKKAPKQR